MKDYEKFYYEYIRELREKHEANVNRIRIGIRINLFLPLAFLILSFAIGGSRFIFLMLWIVSLFGIAAYLIFVEYTDFELQQKLIDLEEREDEKPESLIEGNYLEPHLESLQEKMGSIAEAKSRKIEQIVEVRKRTIEQIVELKEQKNVPVHSREEDMGLITVDEVICSQKDEDMPSLDASGAKMKEESHA